MARICLQAGHLNIKTNCDTVLAQGTGAPGEVSWTPGTRDKVAALLTAHGFAVTSIDANANCVGPYGPFDLTLAIHYQSNTGKSGFGVFVADASVDRDRVRSVQLAKSIATVYAAKTKLENYSSPDLGFGPVTWENDNTRYYYLWRKMNGPLALIECGEGAVGAPDHEILWGQQDMVAAAIAEGVCVAFGVAFVPPAPPKPVVLPVPLGFQVSATEKSFTGSFPVFEAGAILSERYIGAAAVAALAKGATATVSAYSYATPGVPSSDMGNGQPGNDFLWYRVPGGYVTDAILDTTGTPGLPQNTSFDLMKPPDPIPLYSATGDLIGGTEIILASTDLNAVHAAVNVWQQKNHGVAVKITKDGVFLETVPAIADPPVIIPPVIPPIDPTPMNLWDAIVAFFRKWFTGK
jgi:hypothetical protein